MINLVTLLKANLPPGKLLSQCNYADDANDTVDEESATLEHLLYFVAIPVLPAWMVSISKQFQGLLELLSRVLR